MKAAVVQLSSTLDLDRNLNASARFVEGAARAGARLVVLPEVFNRRGESAQVRDSAETLAGATMEWAAAQARQHKVWLLAGSFGERTSQADTCFNCSTLYSPDGQRVAEYRKIHLFDIDVAGAQARESATVTPGEQLVVAEIDAGIKLGMTVCYDLRFPELYRRLTLMGSQIIAVPAAFTEKTGRDHWEVLLRARAIENQVFILAPNQLGTTPGTPTSYGRSMIIDPWGTVLAQAPDQEGFAIAELDFSFQKGIRERLPCLQHRRPDLYGWPDPQSVVSLSR
jgi:predicted amidohydrolase